MAEMADDDDDSLSGSHDSRERVLPPSIINAALEELQITIPKKSRTALTRLGSPSPFTEQISRRDAALRRNYEGASIKTKKWDSYANHVSRIFGNTDHGADVPQTFYGQTDKWKRVIENSFAVSLASAVYNIYRSMNLKSKIFIIPIDTTNTNDQVFEVDDFPDIVQVNNDSKLDPEFVYMYGFPSMESDDTIQRIWKLSEYEPTEGSSRGDMDVVHADVIVDRMMHAMEFAVSMVRTENVPLRVAVDAIDDMFSDFVTSRIEYVRNTHVGDTTENIQTNGIENDHKITVIPIWVWVYVGRVFRIDKTRGNNIATRINVNVANPESAFGVLRDSKIHAMTARKQCKQIVALHHVRKQYIHDNTEKNDTGLSDDRFLEEMESTVSVRLFPGKMEDTMPILVFPGETKPKTIIEIHSLYKQLMLFAVSDGAMTTGGLLRLRWLSRAIADVFRFEIDVPQTYADESTVNSIALFLPRLVDYGHDIQSRINPVTLSERLISIADGVGLIDEQGYSVLYFAMLDNIDHNIGMYVQEGTTEDIDMSMSRIHAATILSNAITFFVPLIAFALGGWTNVHFSLNSKNNVTPKGVKLALARVEWCMSPDDIIRTFIQSTVYMPNGIITSDAFGEMESAVDVLTVDTTLVIFAYFLRGNLNDGYTRLVYAFGGSESLVSILAQRTKAKLSVTADGFTVLPRYPWENILNRATENTRYDTESYFRTNGTDQWPLPLPTGQKRRRKDVDMADDNRGKRHKPKPTEGRCMPVIVYPSHE